MCAVWAVCGGGGGVGGEGGGGDVVGVWGGSGHASEAPLNYSYY